MKKIGWILIVGMMAMIPIRNVWAVESSGESITVSEAVEMALSNNPAFREADANILAAEAEVDSSRAGMLPEAVFSYGYTSLMDAPIMKVMGGEMQTSHQRIYNWDVTVVQPLFTGFALTSKLEMSKLDVTAKKFERQQIELDLTLNVKGACYNLALAERLLSVKQDEVAALGAHCRNAESFYNQGLIRKNDLLRAQVALANSQQQMENARANVQKAEMLLNRLMNFPLDTPVDLSEEGMDAYPPEQYDLDTLGMEALDNRPIMKLMAVGMEQLGLGKKLARSAIYPTLALVGQYEQTGNDPAATNNDYSNDHNASITAQLEWKFWQGGKTRADIASVEQKIIALEAGIEQYQHQIFEEVHSSVLDCRVAGGNIETASEALKQAKENWRITDLQYQQQTALASDVLDARTFLSQADANYYRAVFGYLNALAGLEHAIGKATPVP